MRGTPDRLFYEEIEENQRSLLGKYLLASSGRVKIIEPDRSSKHGIIIEIEEFIGEAGNPVKMAFDGRG